jgi:hypothetical protein
MPPLSWASPVSLKDTFLLLTTTLGEIFLFSARSLPTSWRKYSSCSPGIFRYPVGNIPPLC